MTKPALRMSARRKSGQGNQELKRLLEHGTVEEVPLDQIDRDEDQPRPLGEVMDGIEAFADELERDNFKLAQFPVFHIKDDGRKMIVVGERRTTAFRLKGRETIPAVCKKFTAEEIEQIFILQYVENDGKLKKELSPLADARWWRTYADRYHNGNLSAAAKARGRSAAEVSNRVSLLDADSSIVKFVQRTSMKDPATYAALSRLQKHGNIKMVHQVLTDYERGEIKGSLRVYVESLAKQAKEDKTAETGHVEKPKKKRGPVDQVDLEKTAGVSPPLANDAKGNMKRVSLFNDSGSKGEAQADKGVKFLSDATDTVKRAAFTALVVKKSDNADKYNKYTVLLDEINEAINLLESARSHYHSDRTRLLAEEREG